VRQSVKIPLEREEWFRVIDAIRDYQDLGDAMRAVLGMMAMRGFRCGDVMRMKRAEISAALETGTLSFEAKGSKRLEFAVIDTFRPHLEALAAIDTRWTRVEDTVVAERSLPERRHRAALRAVQRALAAVAASVEIDGVYPHRLRRTYATEYLRSLTGDPEAVVKLMQHMGWSNIATAMEYVNHQRGAELNAPAERMFNRATEG
jgi:integrase